MIKRRKATDDELQKHYQMKGFGDMVKRATDLLHIKQCGGCKKRQEWLNKKIPFKNDSVDSSNNSE